MLGKLLNLGRAPTHRVPDGLTVYAIGDIHGRLDLLEQVHRQIAKDPARGRKLVIYLGDYVDRGPQSREVIELLLGPAPEGWERVFLRGNHEQSMLDYLGDWQVARDWLNFGGKTTLQSYGLRVPFAEDEATLVELQKEVASGVPMRHWAFMRLCGMSHAVGDYLFVHAGVRPGIPWDRQLPDDLMWIRDAFLSSRADHGKKVVHGHTIREGVEFRPNRIGIDTGAYMSGVLTCLVLEGTELRLIQT